VDDEKGFVDTMAKRLENRGFTVGVAYDGPGALEALDRGDVFFDVVVLDVKMPGMDGNEALKLIKSAHPLVEVVMLTGHATVESAIEGMKSGAFDYLMKPCDLDSLMDKIGDAHDKKQAQENRILEARARHIVLRRGE
jgi:DNA-binding NtrC family response regulator